MSLRLNAIADITPKIKIAADIGCDHGKLAAELITRGKAEYVICTDISAKSLEKAKILAETSGISDRISCREGNGLSVLKENEADAAIIAGMGGELIANILDAHKEKAPDCLILSCNTMAHVLRQWLCGNGYIIEDEELIYEGGRYYPVILARKGEAFMLNDIEMEFGPVIINKRSGNLKNYLNIRIENEIKNREKILHFGTPAAKTKLNELDDKIKRYKELRDACKNK